MKYLLVLLSLSFAAQGQDLLSNGNGVGNGGDVVVCPKTIELLDFAEVKMTKRFSMIDLPKRTDHIDLAKARIGKLKALDPKLYDQYSKVLNGIEGRWKLIEKAEFRDVMDSFEIALPENCFLKQIAIQHEFEGKTQIQVSKKLWDQLKPLERAGLVTHEIIYEHFLVLGEKNSIKARQFNAFLFSKEIEKMSKAQYLAYVRNLGLKLY